MADWRDPLWSYATHRVGGPTETWPAEPFPLDDPPVSRLMVVGDIGTGDDRAARTAAVMTRFEAEREVDALLLLGDNVYPSGDPDRLDATVLEPFSAVLDGPTDLLPVLGNHDVRNGNGVRQVRALAMPGRWYETTVGDTLIVALDSTRAEDPVQLAWLEEALRESRSSWVIVMMHHPPYSGGFHGSSKTARQSFVPLFERYGVDLVLSGHDHDYQRSTEINGVTYVVSGAGAKTRRTGRIAETEVAWSTHHFVDVAVWGDRLELRAVNQDGRVFDSFTKK